MLFVECVCVRAYMCAGLHELVHKHLRDLTSKQQLTDVSTALLSAHDEQNGKRVLSCSSYL